MPDPAALAARVAALARRLAAVRDGQPVAIATTAKDEVWHGGRSRVFRYRPLAAAPRLGPMLILHGLIGRQSMTDLEPDRSLVRRLLEAGVDLYVLDWGDAGRADRFNDFTDYSEHFLGDAVATVRAHSGAARVGLFGICQGGVFAAIHASRHRETIKALALAVTPIDFHADREAGQEGLLNLWIRSLPPDLVAALVDERGNLSGQLTGALFQQLTPARTLAKYTSGLIELAADPDELETFLRMEKWLADRPDHPGAAAKEWLVGLYHENRLSRGTFRVAGRPVDLGAIACPVLNIFGAQDHIIPPPCSRALRRFVAPELYAELEAPTGHVGVFVSRRAQALVGPAVARWLAGAG